jgi:Tfp pilus assembly protein PilO
MMLTQYLYIWMHWPKKRLIALIMMMNALIILLGYLLFLQNSFNKVLLHQQELKRLSMELTQQENAIHHLSTYEARAQLLAQEWQALQSQQLNADKIHTVFSELEVLGAKANVHVVHMMQNKMLEITTQGHYNALLVFLQSLQTLPYLLLQDLQIKQSGLGTLQAVLNIQILLAQS